MWILIEHPHVRVRWRTVDVKVVLLDILAVVALAVGQAKQALLEDGVSTVPQREGKAQTLLLIANAGNAVLSPVIGPRARLIMVEVVPCVTALTVVPP